MAVLGLSCALCNFVQPLQMLDHPPTAMNTWALHELPRNAQSVLAS